MSDEIADGQITYLAERFLRWRLPKDFNPDCGISFQKVANIGTSYEYRFEPVGTNLLNKQQAEEMVRFLIKDSELDSAARMLLHHCRDRLRMQLNIGIISVDPENENPQHEFDELLTDISYFLGVDPSQ